MSVVLSALCLVHCIVVPSLAVVMPLGSLMLGQDLHFHGVMLAIIVPVSVIALGAGFARHRRLTPPGFGLAGLALLIGAATFAHAAGNTGLETALTVAGSAALALAHIMNLRAPRVHAAALPA